MSIIMRTKIQTQLGCVNVVASQDLGDFGLIRYSAEVLVRDGKALQYRVSYPVQAIQSCGHGNWDEIKHRILQGLAREAFKEVK